jgi:hypothetical protein
MPARKVVIPRRKKSQWKPAGFLRGNWRAWAVRLLTFYLVLVRSSIINVGRAGAYMVVVEEEHD